MDLIVTLSAKPEAISIDIGKTALLVIDMQNDFGAKGGMFDLAGIDISMIHKVLRPTQDVLAAARGAGLRIIYTKMEYRADLSDAGAPDSPNRIKHARLSVGKEVEAPDGKLSRVLVKGTWNTEILPALAPKNGDIIVSKHRYSAFFQTNLDSILKTIGIKYLIFTGCTTSVCVESTIRDAMFRDYSPILLQDCAGEPIGHGLPRSNHEATLLTIQNLFGWVSDSEKFIKALRG